MTKQKAIDILTKLSECYSTTADECDGDCLHCSLDTPPEDNVQVFQLAIRLLNDGKEIKDAAELLEFKEVGKC